MSARRIFLIDDDDEFRSNVQNSLGRAYFVTHAASEAEFRQVFRPYTFDLIILDMRLESGREGLKLLREILAYDELQPVIMVSAYGDTDAVLDSAETGAMMFLHKQEFTPELLARMVEAVLQQAQVRRHLAALQVRVPSGTAIGLMSTNPALRRAMDLVQQAADDPECTVLIAGEGGAGHDLAAQVIHGRSRKRSEAPLVTACGLSTWSGEAQTALLGCPRRGGAPRQKGLLEQANGGVFFFDRIDVLDVGLRTLLGDILRKRSLDFGSPEPLIPLDVQLVAGTDMEGIGSVVDTLRDSAAGDRLMEIYLPPLRERREDIPMLAAFFLQELRREGRTTARTLARDALVVLEAHSWPGNLPELRNAVEFGAIKAMSEGSEELAREYLPANLLQAAETNGSGSGRWDYRYHLARTEVALTHRALQVKGVVSKAQLAEMLGYSDRFAFSRRVRKALDEFPDLAREFPQVRGMFRIVDC